MKPKSYRIEIVINGVVIKHRIIKADEDLRKQLYFSLRELQDAWSEAGNLENEIDELIANGVNNIAELAKEK